MAVLSVSPENPLLWAFLMEYFYLGIAKMSVIPKNPLFLIPLLPKTSVLGKRQKLILSGIRFFREDLLYTVKSRFNESRFNVKS